MVAADHAEAEHRAAQRLGAVHRPLGYPACPPTPDAPGLVLSPTASVGERRDVRRARRRPRRRRDRRRLSRSRTTRSSASRRARGAAATGRSSSAPARRSARARSSSPSAGSATGAIIGDQAYVRERARDRRAARVDRPRQRASTTTSSVGDRVSVQTGVYLTAFSVVEDDVFVGPVRDDDERRHDEPPRAPDAAARRDAAARVPRRRRRRCSRPASRSARRRSSPRARSSRATSRRARSCMGVPARVGARGRRRGPAGALAVSASR